MRCRPVQRNLRPRGCRELNRIGPLVDSSVRLRPSLLRLSLQAVAQAQPSRIRLECPSRYATSPKHGLVRECRAGISGLSLRQAIGGSDDGERAFEKESLRRCAGSETLCFTILLRVFVTHSPGVYIAETLMSFETTPICQSHCEDQLHVKQ